MDPLDQHEVLTPRKYKNGVDLTVLTSMERKFITMYQQLPYLWNPTHPDYNNRHRRNAGYDNLLPIFKQYMPKATRFHIRQKINIIRSCYRKELRKHLASRTVTSDGKVAYSYVPNSWKFHALRFLDCDEYVENEVENAIEIESCPEFFEDDQEFEFVQDAETESGNDEPDTSKIRISPMFVEEEKTPSRKRRHSQKNWNEPLLRYCNEEEVLQREYNAIGANVACKLQRMTPQQRYCAELLINKVLIQGLKQCLTEETDLTVLWHDDNVSYSKEESKEGIIGKNSDN